MCSCISTPGLGGKEANSSPFWPTPLISLLRPGTLVDSLQPCLDFVHCSFSRRALFFLISRIGLGCCVPLDQVPQRLEQGRVVHHIEEKSPPRPFWLLEHFGPWTVPCWFMSPNIE